MRTSTQKKSTAKKSTIKKSAPKKSREPVSQESTELYARKNPRYNDKKARRSSKVPLIVAVAVGSLAVLLMSAGFAYAVFMNSLNQELAGDKTSAQQQAITDVLAPPPTSYTEPFYMLLVGSDARASDSSMGKRSDTNILARIDASTGTVTLVSIPRDTRVDIDGYGTDKFNAAYSYGGVALTITETNQLCGVNISHYAEIDFDKLIALVDVVGGVEVDVPELISDPDAGNVVIQPGLQTLNGEAALVFARSRDYADGDFTRTANQRLLIEAIVKKVLSLPVNELPNVVMQAAGCVTTDLRAETLIDLALQFKNAEALNIYSAMVPSTTATISGISYVLYDRANLAEMMKLVNAGKDPKTLVQVTPDYGSVPPQNGNSGDTAGTTDTYTPPPASNEVPVAPNPGETGGTSGSDSGGTTEEPPPSGGGDTGGSTGADPGTGDPGSTGP